MMMIRPMARQTNDANTQALRRAELHTHPAPPPGLEVHRAGLRHEVQRGDAAYSLAREYSQAYHMDISAAQLQAANKTAFSNGIFPGELLEIPGLQARFDSAIANSSGPVVDVRHTVQRGDTLSSLARRYSASSGTAITWQNIYDVNRDTIGANPSRIFPGQVLVIPNTGRPTNAPTVPPLQTIEQLNGDLALTRVGRVKHESGQIESLDIMRFTADGANAERHSSVDEAIAMSHAALAEDAARSNPIAIVQTRDGAAYAVPVKGSEVSDNLDDSDKTLSLGWRAGQREVVAVVEERATGVEVRRFDR